MKDEQLRRDVANAFTTARGLYDELVGARNAVTVANRVATDEEVRERLRTAIEDLRSAANRLQGKQQRSHRGRKTLLIAALALGILFNPMTGPETRRWLKDAIGGGSDDFGGDYSSNGGAS